MTLGMFELNLGLRIHDEWEGEEFFDTTHIRTTIPPDAYTIEIDPCTNNESYSYEGHLLKFQQPTFWQKIKKFFVGYY
jgi:hypothetical protein